MFFFHFSDKLWGNLIINKRLVGKYKLSTSIYQDVIWPFSQVSYPSPHSLVSLYIDDCEEKIGRQLLIKQTNIQYQN